MIQKRKPPWGMFFILLLLALAASYYIAGLFNQKGDPFWDDGVGLYLQSLFEYEWLQAKEEGRTASMLGILDLVNKET